MKLHPRVTKTAVELVKRFEGLRRRAARLPDGAWTIGYGHTKSAREGVEVSPDEAELLLFYDLTEVATKVEAWTFTPLNQNQFEALIAFAFNIGAENFRGSTVLKRINEGQPLQAAAAMELWRKTEVNGEGIVVDALVRRRAAEKAHFLTPPEGFRPSPSQVLRPAYDFSVVEAANRVHRSPFTPPPKAAVVVQPPLDEPSFIPSKDPFSETLAPKTADDDAPALSEAAPAVALAAHEPSVQAPEQTADEPLDSPVNDLSDPNDPFPGAFIATPVGRSFEPPPSRYDKAPESVLPAGEHLGDGANVPPLEIPQSLFGSPSAQLKVNEASPPFTAAAPLTTPRRAGSDGLLSRASDNRSLLWAVVGGFGLLFFILAIVSMLLGRASLVHLVVGFIGILMLTPAGVYFLLRRSAGAPPAMAEFNPTEPSIKRD